MSSERTISSWENYGSIKPQLPDELCRRLHSGPCKPLITAVPEYLPKRICRYRIPTHGSNGQTDRREVAAAFCP
jgi:hypothetical protein